MKQIYLLLFLLFTMVTNVTCTKDEISEKENLTESVDSENLSTESELAPPVNPGNRDGFVDLIFYRTSLTSDNYLLQNSSESRLRIHKIYNKQKIKNIKFQSTGKSDVNVNSILMSHYKIEITYNDNTIESFTAFSKKQTSSFVFVPSGDNLLSSTNDAKFISYETPGSSSIIPNTNYYNPLRNETYQLFRWTIKKNNTIVGTRELEPLTKNSKQFMVLHVN